MRVAVVPRDLEALRQLPRDELSPPDPLVPFVDSIVDSLDLDGLGLHAARRPNWREPHPVSTLLKLFLFAGIGGTVSMRALARACRWDLRLLYLSHYDPPGRSSIGRFWRANYQAFFGVFETLVRRAAEAGLVGMDLHAVDGTKMRAASSMLLPLKLTDGTPLILADGHRGACADGVAVEMAIGRACAARATPGWPSLGDEDADGVIRRRRRGLSYRWTGEFG